jgi:ABC-type Fe3+/spermidine/putrescine transport system ATPase subunit
MMMINLTRLRVELRNFALQDINLNIERGDYFMLVGPTGAGKTLLLETIAGLHKVQAGEIRIENTDITLLEPEKRNFSMVYQDCALFPHLSIAENIIFGLRVRHAAEGSIKKELAEIASLMKVDHLLDRKPGKLSGGEKQKVALARALAIKPRLLLLDEPLSALDPEGREGLQLELKRIHQELKITVIHVTHDFDEALILGKHIAVMGAGSIRQTGTPGEVFRRPNSEFVAHFTMMRNILPGELLRKNENLSLFRSGNIELVTNIHADRASHACIRPEDISLSADISSRDGPNSFIGRVVMIEDRGMGYYVIVDVPPEICCLITRRDFSQMDLAVGQNVKISFDPDAVHVF